ncbi:hypothetical protein QF035_003059 [Streptomyces umbrinus]|uniref:Uncharacterized protein n=1 Tax=Streptomyces umbrinus TaxID=67370 RepID=A0ABU0SQC2_9ACTN|nr:hypothetical protein [Streptomyces umbrinus]
MFHPGRTSPEPARLADPVDYGHRVRPEQVVSEQVESQVHRPGPGQPGRQARAVAVSPPDPWTTYPNEALSPGSSDPFQSAL